MDERRRERSDRLPAASETFTRAIFDGADDIRRYERRRGRRRALGLVAAALALAAVGIGAAVNRLAAPRPDNVVLSVNPERAAIVEAGKAASAAPTRAPELTPEPTPEPEQADSRSAVDAADGTVYLTDQGPFQPGEWLCLAEAGSGLLDAGVEVPFHELPSDDSRVVYAAEGMLVRYLAGAENGFARVNFAGNEGYVPAGYLFRPPRTPRADWASMELYAAHLYMTNASGEVEAKFISQQGDGEAMALYALQKVLTDAEPSERELSFGGGLLVAWFRDPDGPTPLWDDGTERLTMLRLTLPRNGSVTLMTDDGAVYAVPANDKRVFWAIFQELMQAWW